MRMIDKKVKRIGYDITPEHTCIKLGWFKYLFNEWYVGNQLVVRCNKVRLRINLRKRVLGRAI